jgi:predicted ester cyclase
MCEHHRQVDVIWPGASSEGRDRIKNGITRYRSAYPDLQFTIRSVVCDEQQRMCFVEWTASGSQTGQIGDREPSGKMATFGGVSCLFFDSDGKIEETRVYRQPPEDELKAFAKRMLD